MRPNLSVESIAGALAVLGTGVLMAACGGGDAPKTPVTSTEVPGAHDGTKAAGDTAAHCGAGKEHKAGEASCSADHHAGDAKTHDATGAAKPDTTPASTTPATATPSDAKPATDTKPATPAATPVKKPATAPAAKKGGAGSCGAGTCSAKK